MPANARSYESRDTAAPVSPLDQLDEEGRLELDRRLGAWQRQRVLAYFAIAATIMALSFALGTFHWPSPDPERPDDPVWRFDNPAVGNFADTLADGLMTLILLCGLLVSLPRHRTHQEVVATLQVTLVALTVVIVAVAPFAAGPEVAADGASTTGIAAGVAVAGAVGIFLFHLGASALVALSPREALRPLIPMALIFALVVLFVAPVPWPERVGLASLGALAGLPGLFWSVARYRRFQDRFVARVLRRRVDDIDRDLDNARRLHESLLPTPIREGPVRVDYVYEPMQAIGGDFLVLRRSDAGDIVALVADVTGHGIAAALAVNRLHGEIDRLLVEHRDADPSRILAGLNRYACAALAPQGIFATAICVRIDPKSGRLHWANAGHPPALLMRADGERSSMPSSACMLGVLDASLFDISGAHADLLRGDRVLLYTDGASEASDRDGRMFGIEGIHNGDWTCADGAHDPLRALAEAIARFRAGPPRDDLLAVDIVYMGA